PSSVSASTKPSKPTKSSACSWATKLCLVNVSLKVMRRARIWIYNSGILSVSIPKEQVSLCLSPYPSQKKNHPTLYRKDRYLPRPVQLLIQLRLMLLGSNWPSRTLVVGKGQDRSISWALSCLPCW